MSVIEGWSALRLDGAVQESKVRGGGLAGENVREAVVRVDSGALRVKVRPELGERLKVYTRRELAADFRGNPTGDASSTVVIEIAPDPDRPDRLVRLSIGAEVVLSTGD